MKVSVIGVGHVGLVTAACMADLGHDVIGMDDDHGKVEAYRRGHVVFYEEGLEDLVRKQLATGRLRFTGEVAEAVDGPEVVFICVGTPSNSDGSPNLTYVQQAAASVARHARKPLVVSEKSTVPVRTGERIRHALAMESQARGHGLRHEVVSNPEFLREGTAVADTLRPDRVVVGADSPHAHEVMRALYQPLLEKHPCPYVATDVRTAELIKHASNAFLATKISFANALARVCELAGADVQTVADAMGHDPRIGRAFLNAGLGYGGSCLVGQETVLVRRGESFAHLTMEELWAEVSASGVEGLEVLSWLPEERRAGFWPVSAVTARPYRGEIYQVRTKMGRRLRCTADHPFVVCDDGQGGALTVRMAEALTTADWLPVATGDPALDADVALVGSPLAALGAGSARSTEVIQRLSPQQLEVVRQRSRELPAPRRYDVLRTGALRLHEFQGMGVDVGGGTYGTAKNGTYVPGDIPLDEAFWRMIGLFLAEGYITRDGRRVRVCWALHPTDEQDLVDFLTGYWHALDVETSVHRRDTATVVSISSRLLGSWFADVLRLGKDCYRKRVPDLAWGATGQHRRALLRGLWDGDGSSSLVAGGPSVVAQYGTVSPQLADGILRLLGGLGLVARLRVGRTRTSTVDTYWITLSGAGQIERASWLFPSHEAQEILASIHSQQKRIAPTGYRRGADQPGTAWVRVAGVDREPFDGWVYSLEVPGAHTIVATGGLVTHNCFPKDVNAFVHIAAELGYDFGILRETDRVNREAKSWPLSQLRRLLWNLSDKEIAVLGVAFKPGTDDIRDAPALDVIDALRAEGATVRLHDPVALDHVRDRYPDAVFCDKAEDALRGAHAVVVCTEWDEYRALRPERLAELLEYPVVIDARLVWDAGALAAAGLTVARVGSPLVQVPGA